MEQTAHMRLTGHTDPFSLTPAAHRHLLQYLTEARMALAAEPDGDETVRDMEAAIGDRLAALRADADQPVDDAQMREVLAEAGPVSVERSSSAGGTPRGPFWCRITEGKWLGGICLGIAARGQFDVAWVRSIVVAVSVIVAGLLAPLAEGIPMLGYLALTALGYLALLLVLPPVSTVDEYEGLRDAPRPER